MPDTSVLSVKIHPVGVSDRTTQVLPLVLDFAGSRFSSNRKLTMSLLRLRGVLARRVEMGRIGTRTLRPILSVHIHNELSLLNLNRFPAAYGIVPSLACFSDFA